MRTVAALVATAAVCASASGQLASVVVSHDDPDGVVLPGETIRVTTIVSWTNPNLQFAGIKGNLAATPNVGSGAAKSSAYTNGGLVNLGQFVGGSIIGIDIAQTPAFFTGGFVVPPSGNYWGFEVVGYDWTAPASGFEGEVRFDFQCTDPGIPDVRFFPPLSGGPWFPQPGYTGFFGTAIVVVPGPGTVIVCSGLAGVCVMRRRR